MVLDFSRNLILTKLSESTKCKALIFFLLFCFSRGGVRVCNDAILLDLWCSFEGIFILSCSIAVLQNQAVWGVWKFSGNFSAACSSLCYSVWCLNIQVVYFCAVLEYSYTPYIVRLPPSLWHFIKGTFNQVNMVCHTYNHKKKIRRVVYLVLRAAFSCWSCFLIVLHCLAVCLAVPLNQDSKICNTVQSITGRKSHWQKLS